MTSYNLPQYSTRNTSFHTQASILDRILAALPAELATILQNILDRQSYSTLGYSKSNTTVHGYRIPRTLKHVQQRVRTNWRSWFNLPNACILIWALLLLWGERWIFESTIQACRWENWERWPPGSTPHRLALLADPQIVDPHTYPGRPWPLSRLTEKHTDQYMRRSHIQLQKHLKPDTVIFMGDLFDGGREWMARGGTTDDPSWANPKRPASEAGYAKYWKKKYRDKFWLWEYERFGNIFFNHWNDFGAGTSLEQRGRKIITGLPGNHDFGFGTNVREFARQRFQTFFGETNRVDVIGNHSFVSLDGLSLSARGSPIDSYLTKTIFQPVEEFLSNVPAAKRRALTRELKYRAGESEYLAQAHVAQDIGEVDFKSLPTLDQGEGGPKLPTILLTHVPLYRDPGAACGPMRERSPPAVPAITPDIRNGIPLGGGYQYQNTLSDTDSLDVLKQVEDVVHVFSGDDHDYCELMHKPEQGGVKEITIKSMSWAMGVRKPGFLLVSLWNPIDSSGESIGTHSGGHGPTSENNLPMTVETHLCLQPDQIGILLRYATLLGFTLAVLIIRAMLVPVLKLHPFSPVSHTPPTPTAASDYSLPTFSTAGQDQRRNSSPHRDSDSSTSSTSSNSVNGAATLAPRSTFARTRSVSPGPNHGGYGYALPSSTAPQYQSPPVTSQGSLIDRAGYFPKESSWKKNDDSNGIDEEAEWGSGRTSVKIRELTKVELGWREAWTSIVWVAGWVFGGYLWLVWRG